jgi:hypothetical protein
VKRLISAVLFIALIVLPSGCGKGGNATGKIYWSLSKYSEITDKKYEETSQGYRAAFYTLDEISVDRIKIWLDSCDQKGKYCQYIYSDPDSWDMFLYYQTDAKAQYDQMKFNVLKGCVNMHVKSSAASDAAIGQYYMLLRVQAPLRGSWPTSSRLFIDDSEISLCDSEFSF